MSGFLLYGIVELEAPSAEPLAAGTSLVSFRDLGAVVTASPYERRNPSVEEIETHRAVVDAVCVRRPFLPAPIGVVFRAEEALVRWLELHYVTLREGLTFVEGRLAARVHMTLRDGALAEDIDVPALASESFRHFRSHAAASVVLRTPDIDRHASAAFLVERDRWGVFVDMVKEEARHHPSLRFEQTGPWPPYDFVNMQFGI